MQKYKIINKSTNEETTCTKVVIDCFDYYVISFVDKKNSYIIEKGKAVVKYIKNLGDDLIWESLDKKSSACDGKTEFEYTVIATNNPNIDLPKVIDEVEKLADICSSKNYQRNLDGSTDKEGITFGFIEGYNKSQELYPNSDNDMIEFGKFISNENYVFCVNGEWIKNGDGTYKVIANTTKELLAIWKSQQPKIIFY